MKRIPTISKFRKHLNLIQLRVGVRSLYTETKWTKQKDGYPPGVITSAKELAPVTGMTLPEFIFQNLHKWENAPAIKCAITGRQYTHGQIYKLSRSFAAALKHAKFQRGDSICCLLPNIPEYPIAAFGSILAGCVVSTINPAYTKDEIAKQVNDCDGKVIITIPQLIPLVQAAKVNCPSLTEKIIVISNEPVDECHSFFEMLKTDATGVDLLQGKDIKNTADEVCLLPYSSGTTGIPKGVMLTHGSLSTNLNQITQDKYRQTNFFEGGNSQERFLAILPFFHMYGFHVIMSCALYQGGFLTCLPKFEPETYVKALMDHKPTKLHLVTPLINFVASHPQVPASILSDLEGVIIGAAPLGKELINKFLTKFGDHIFLQEGYGMTEAVVTHFIPTEMHNSKPGSCGAQIPGVSSKIIELGTGKILGPNKSGEICVHGAMMMKGYLRNEKATADTIDNEKFLHTGDIGYYDEEGILYIEDRLKDLIKVKGLQVAPSEIEDVLRKHEDVADVAILGVPNERLGEAPRGYIVRKNKSLSADDIHNFLKPQLAEHKQLAGGIEFVEAIPKAASGKILKRQLLLDFKSKQKN